MPIYEYQCEACTHKFEVIQKVSDGLLTECPACKQNKLRKMVTAAAFRLKGGGWYETDFKDKKSQKNTSGGSESSDTDKKSDKSTTSASDTGSASTESKSGSTDKSSTETKTASPPASSIPKPAAD